MVTDLPEGAVPPLVRVAVKVTDWPTAGAVVDGESESWVVCVALVPELVVNAFMQMLVLAL